MIGHADLPAPEPTFASPAPATPFGEPLVDAATVAAFLSVDTATVYRLAQRAELPGIEVAPRDIMAMGVVECIGQLPADRCDGFVSEGMAGVEQGAERAPLQILHRNIGFRSLAGRFEDRHDRRSPRGIRVRQAPLCAR